MPDETLMAAPILYCRFRVGTRQFGVPVALVKEVHAPTTITPIPGAPMAVRGYVNLRGTLYLVLDPCELLTAESGTVAEDGDFIVFNAIAGEAFVIQTDGVGEVIPIHGEQIDVPKAEAMRCSEDERHQERLITGYAKLDQTLVTLVEPRELLSAVFHGSPSE